MGSNAGGLQNVANTLQGGQTQMFNNVLGMLHGGYGSIAGGLMNQLGPLSGIFGNMLSGAGQMTPQLMQQFMQLGSNPQALAALTGVNAPGLVQGATSYLSQPGQTNLARFVPGAMGQLAPGQSALNMAGPQAMNVYRGMLSGINPQFAQNAQNQLTQQYGTSVGDILAQAAPGQNTQAGLINAQNNLLTSGANLGGQLAGQSQQIAAQGAGGLVGTGQAMDANTLQRLMSQYQMAGGLDQQTMQMLMGGAQLGTGYNQQVLGNIGQGVQMGMSGLQGAEQLGQLGVGMNQYGMNMMSGMGGQLGSEAEYYTQMAAQEAAASNPWTIGASLLGGLGGAYLGGPGAAGLAGGKGGGGGMNPQQQSIQGTMGMNMSQWPDIYNPQVGGAPGMGGMYPPYFPPP